jgi:hypothetical protein
MPNATTNAAANTAATLTIEQFASLAQQTSDPSVSILMPVYRAAPETQQNPIRLRNLLREAEEQLHARGMTPLDAQALLEPAAALIDDNAFWQERRDGLAIFVADGVFAAHHLPFSVGERVTIAERFHLAPLLPLFTADGRYFVLAISKQDVRLFAGTRETITQIDLPEDTPRSLDASARLDGLPQGVQWHTGTAPAGPGGGERQAMYFGHGAGEDDEKMRIERYLNKVDHGVRARLGDDRAPLVLAGVEYLLPIYRQESEYPMILEEAITGNPDDMRADELRERAWNIVEPHFRAELEEIYADFARFKATDQASDDLDEIVRAAAWGRVMSLVVARGAPEIWGRFLSDEGKVIRRDGGPALPDDVLLVDYAATQTLLNGGAVYAVEAGELPTDAPALALFRYAVKPE